MSGAALLALLLALLLPSGALGFGSLSSFGTWGEGAGQLRSPHGVAIDSEGTTYVADLGNRRVSVFAADGGFLRAFGKEVRPGGGDVCTAATGCREGFDDFSDESLPAPYGVALGPEGRLFVSDLAHQHVAVFDPDGGFRDILGEGRLDEPTGIEFDRAGLLYVADSGTARIDVFTPKGDFVREVSGAMSSPHDVAFGPDGELVVVDRGNNRIDVFDSAGSFMWAFGKEVNLGAGDPNVCSTECQAGAAGDEPGAFDAPNAVAVDATGTVYVSDGFNDRISVSRIDGAFLREFEVTPEPTGVALDCQGAVFVVEQSFEFARVERFGEPGTPHCVPPRREPVTPLHLAGTPAPPLALPDSKFQFGKLVLNRKRGTGTLFVFVPGPGRLTLSGTDLRTVRRNAPRRGGLVKMPVTPRGELKRKLRKKGRAKGRVRVSFKPTDGIARIKRRPILLLKRRS